MTWMTPLLAWTSVATTATLLPAASVRATEPSPPTLTLKDVSLDGADILAVQTDDVGGQDGTRDDVVREDLREVTGRVFQQSVDGTRRQRGEGLVGGGEHGEGTVAGERCSRPAARTAATKVVKSPAATAVSMMLLSAAIAASAGAAVVTAAAGAADLLCGGGVGVGVARIVAAGAREQAECDGGTGREEEVFLVHGRKSSFGRLSNVCRRLVA